MIKITFEQGTSFSPRIIRIVTDSILSQITTAGWLNSAVSEGISIQPTDSILIAYNDGSSGITTDFFQLSIAAGTKIITLSLETASFPQPGATSGKIIISNGTNWIASTSLWPNTVGTASNLLYSNGTSNVYLATGNYGVLVTNSTGVPSISAGGQIPGTRTNDSASAGNCGEYISSTVLVGSAVSLVSGTATNITSISLTAGDWDVSGNIAFVGAAGTTATTGVATINTTSGTAPTIPGAGAYNRVVVSAVNSTIVLPTGSTRISLASTTTVYLIGASAFSGGTSTAYGFIGARRAR